MKEPSPSKGNGTGEAGPARVLIADDDKHLLKALSRELRNKGFMGTAVADGEAALDALLKQDFDVALIDLDMPKLNGFEVLAAIQERGLTTIPVVLTGMGNVSGAVKAMKLGAFDFLEKPCDPELVEQALRRATAYREMKETSRRMTELVEQWESTFNASTDPMVAIALDGNIVRCNRAAAAHAGADRGLLAGQNCHAALCGDGHPADQCPFATQLEPLDSTMFEAEIWGGSFEIASAALLDEGGEPWGRLFTARDITERERVEAALVESEETLRAMAEAAQDAILMMDASGRISFFNTAAEVMFGWPADEAMGKDLHSQLMPEQYQSLYESGIARFRQTGQGVAVGETVELTARRRNGGEFPIEISLSGIPIRGEWHAVAVIRDITARKKAKEILQASEEKYRQIVDNVGLGIALIDPDMRILELNHQMRAWFPEIVAEERPACYRAFNHPPRNEPCSYCPTSRTLMDGQVHEATSSTPGKDGAHNYRIISSPIRDLEGRVVAAIEIVDDVTEKLQLEQELNQSQKLEAVGRLAAGIAHEINTPTQYVGDNIEFLQIAHETLFGLIGVLRRMVDTEPGQNVAPEMLSEARELMESSNLEYLAEQIPKAIEQSIEGVGRVASIVQAMKEFSHPGTTEKTRVDLNQCIRSTATVSRNEWKYVADLDMDLDETLPHVACLPGEFNQVVLNMIVNAAHAIGDVVGGGGERKGKITISTRPAGDWAEVRISDTGSGIPEATRERIFDPFFTTKEVGRGTGQGLAIARNVVVDKHGGTISVESETGKGTTFTIRLPIEPPQGAADSVDTDDSEPWAPAQ